MANPIILKYALDPTGVAASNKVSAEPHDTGTKQKRIIVPSHGCFYKEGLIVRNTRTNALLNINDYSCAEYQPHPSKKFGKEIYSVILITNQAVLGDRFSITYQAVGGEFSFSSDAIKRMYDSVMLDDRPVEWGNIIGKEEFFKPLDHLHDIGDFYGAEGIVFALENIRRAILIGDSASHDEIYKYIDELEKRLVQMNDGVTAALNAHIQNKNNPHGTNKTHVGLSNIPNAVTINRLLDNSETLLLAKAMFDHNKSGDHDARYVLVEENTGSLKFRWRAGKLECKPESEPNWIQIHPQVWQ